MVLKAWGGAVIILEQARSIPFGDQRTTVINLAICYFQLGDKAKGKEVVKGSMIRDWRDADHAILGLLKDGEERLKEFSLAIHVPLQSAEEVTKAVSQRLAELCRKQYLGLDFSEDDWLKIFQG
jgi:hypothetical protein